MIKFPNVPSKIVRKARTIANFLGTSTFPNGVFATARGLQLVDEMAELIEQAKVNGEWDTICFEQGWDTATDAYDFFA